jgi:hypothetical protein
MISDDDAITESQISMEWVDFYGKVTATISSGRLIVELERIASRGRDRRPPHPGYKLGLDTAAVRTEIEAPRITIHSLDGADHVRLAFRKRRRGNSAMSFMPATPVKTVPRPRRPSASSHR